MGSWKDTLAENERLREALERAYGFIPGEATCSCSMCETKRLAFAALNDGTKEGNDG